MARTLSLEGAAEFLGIAVRPLTYWTDNNEVLRYVKDLGWIMPSVPAGFALVGAAANVLSDAVADLLEARFNDDDVTAPAAAVVGAVAGVIGSVEALPTSLRAQPGGLPPTYLADSQIAENIVTRVLDRVIVDAISGTSTGVRTLLLAVGVIEYVQVPVLNRGKIFIPSVQFDRLRLLLTDQRQLLEQVYGWGTPTIKRDPLFTVLREIGYGLTAGGDERVPSAAFIAAMFPGTTSTPEQIGEMLEVPLLGLTSPSPAIAVLPAPKADPAEAQGVALLLTGAPDLEVHVPVGPVTFSLTSDLSLEAGVGVLLRPLLPPTVIADVEAGGTTPGSGTISLRVERTPAPFPFEVVSFAGGSGVQIKSFFAGLELQIEPTDLVARAGIEGGLLVISFSDGDGFLGSVMPTKPIEVGFDLAIAWSRKNGVSVTGSAALEATFPVNVTVGPVEVQSIRVLLKADTGGITAQGGLDASVKIGPVVATVQGVGAKGLLKFESGNLGPVDFDPGFLPPSGLGIAVSAGPVHGGGFISFEPDLGRYSGAVELSIYDISVKAFGLIETKVPGVSFSFVIVISAEFTPIQLGFGFTLNGVGGLVGINRTIASNELGKLVREGRSENLLFPKNLIANAPMIIRDLGTVFPARNDHYVFGPLGKFGWGTPTLITAQIGIILEIPGPVIVILGEVKVLLPKPSAPLVKMNMSVVGTLDFPNKTFSIDAALHDSIIQGYPISGQMALRVKWGDQPNFVASVGGFHPAYQPPKEFPKLQPMALDLGQHGSASITVSGFFAVTSNTVQVGGDARLHAGGSGISLDASVSVKALFVFSPFAFQANIDASVRISFHGYGPSVHLHGLLEGPSPWHIRGGVCVSILFWDACLGFDETFGGGQPESVPEIDPFFGTTEVIGLRTALQDAGNWSGVLPAGTANVVSRAQGSETLVDPLGGLTVHQKAVPVETDQPISRFGVAKVKTPIPYKLPADGATIGGGLTLTKLSPVNDFFAPAQYFQMDDGKKLSAPGFEQQQSGYVFGANANNLRAGTNAGVTLKYQTFLIAGDGTISDAPVYEAPNAHVTGLNKRSPVAVGGSAQVGTRRFIDRLITQAFDVLPPTFILSNNLSLTPITGLLAAVSRSSVLLSLDAYRLQKPEERLQVQVSASHELAA